MATAAVTDGFIVTTSAKPLLGTQRTLAGLVAIAVRTNVPRTLHFQITQQIAQDNDVVVRQSPPCR